MMNFSQDQFEQIEAYLENRLSGAALQQFEARLQQDKVLADQVTLQREMMQSIEKAAVLDFKKKLNIIHDEVIPPNTDSVKKTNTFQPWWVLIVLILLGGIVWWYNIHKTTSPSIEKNIPNTPSTDNKTEEKIFAEEPPIQRTIDKKEFVNGQLSTLAATSLNLTIYSTNQDHHQFSWPESKQIFLYWTGEKPDSNTLIELQSYDSNDFYLKIGTQQYVIYKTKEVRDLVIKK